ncbi:hypothetical protein [Neotabrizicola sp. sgz301269]|uniref:hypothetical protein n=1 Tax=Neotabrizicola sp. sgz301269 TaxID=3276282 RepID=UPI00376FCB70
MRALLLLGLLAAKPAAAAPYGDAFYCFLPALVTGAVVADVPDQAARPFILDARQDERGRFDFAATTRSTAGSLVLL